MVKKLYKCWWHVDIFNRHRDTKDRRDQRNYQVSRKPRRTYIDQPVACLDTTFSALEPTDHVADDFSEEMMAWYDDSSNVNKKPSYVWPRPYCVGLSADVFIALCLQPPPTCLTRRLPWDVSHQGSGLKHVLPEAWSNLGFVSPYVWWVHLTRGLDWDVSRQMSGLGCVLPRTCLNQVYNQGCVSRLSDLWCVSSNIWTGICFTRYLDWGVSRPISGLGCVSRRCLDWVASPDIRPQFRNIILLKFEGVNF